jgi:hypothetical protein
MPGKRIALLAAFLMAGWATHAAAECSQTLVFNHGSKTISLKGSTQKIEGELPTFRASGAVCLEVEGTSTGAFDISFDTTSKEDLGNLAAMKAFWSDFKPLQIGLLQSALPPARPGPSMAPSLMAPIPEVPGKREQVQKVKELRTAILALDEVIDQGRDLAFRTVAAIAQLGREPGKTQSISAQFDDCASGTGPADMSALASCKKTLEELETLPDRLNALVKALKPVLEKMKEEGSDLAADETAAALVSAARERRQGFDKLVASARQLRQLVQRVREAKTSVTGPTVRPEWDEGLAVVVTITPISVGELGSLGGLGATFKIKILPSKGPRLSAGAMLLYAPNATYSTYAEVEQADGSRVVAEGGALDRRLLWGLTLSTTWSVLDDREGSGLALFLPELVVSPDDDGLAVGLGLSASWKVARLSTGLLWVKHPILEGPDVGAVLEENQKLRVRDGYSFGSPIWYLGLGLAL